MIGAKHDWANLNTLRSYPLVYSKNPVADTGLIFSDQVISDLSIIAHSATYDPRLSSIHLSSEILTLCFFDIVSQEDSFIVQAPMSSSYVTASLINIGSVQVNGSVIFGSFKELLKYKSTGLHKFDRGASTVDEHCILISGARTLINVSGADQKLDGDISLVTQGMLVASATTTNDGYDNIINNIIFSLLDPEKFVEKCAIPETICDCVIAPIEKINNVYPDQTGNINIIAEELDFNNLQLENYENNIIVSVVGSNREVCNLGLPSADGLLPSEQ